ncbi:MAG: hypothetical protein LCI00_02030 [Chloroflexi bacterium]|nr:hypothetical protein [Chloroflexota bacterium]MCC6895531.1 hypothetical protein [Anaerolineae bacterium]
MAQNNILHWLDGRGWLVLSGGNKPDSDVRAQTIGHIAADGGVAYVTFGSSIETTEMLMSDLQDLGAPPGYFVDVLTEDDDTIRAKLGEASLIVVEAGDDPSQTRSGLLGAAVEGMQKAFENGAVVLLEGSSASVFGTWILLNSGEIRQGIGWVSQVFVLPGVTAVAQSEAGRTALAEESSALAIGIGEGSALALGPDGEVEPWGGREVTVALGRSFTSSSST